jgi:hypothetical protein
VCGARCYQKEPYNSSLDDSEKAHRQPTMNEAQFNSLLNHIPGVIYRILGDEHFSISFMSEEIENLSAIRFHVFMLIEKMGILL